jgi:hypothetical protein
MLHAALRCVAAHDLVADVEELGARAMLDAGDKQRGGVDHDPPRRLEQYLRPFNVCVGVR